MCTYNKPSALSVHFYVSVVCAQSIYYAFETKKVKEFEQSFESIYWNEFCEHTQSGGYVEFGQLLASEFGFHPVLITGSSPCAFHCFAFLSKHDRWVMFMQDKHPNQPEREIYVFEQWLLYKTVIEIFVSCGLTNFVHNLFPIINAAFRILPYSEIRK